MKIVTDRDCTVGAILSAWGPVHLSRPGITTFVALDGEAVAGAATVDVYDDATAYLSSLWVDPAFRRQGAATDLIDAVTSHAARHRCLILYLNVDETNDAARALYQKLGFQGQGVSWHKFLQENPS